MFKNLSFKAKLLALCVGLLSVSVFVGAISYFSSAKVNSDYEFIVDKSFPKSVLVEKMFGEYRRVRIMVRTLGISGITPMEADKAIKGAEDSIAKYEEMSKAYVALGFVPGQKELYDQVEKHWADFKAVGVKSIGYYKSGTAADREKMLSIFWKDCPEMAAVYTTAAEELMKFHDTVAHHRAEEANASAATATKVSLFTIIAGLLVGLGVGFTFATSLAKTIGQIVEGLNENARQVSSASSQIAASSEELSQAATEQAASLEETAASIEEMSAMVKKNSDNAVSAAGTSADSQKKAVRGKGVVEQMLGSMTEIDASNNQIMGQINHSNQQMTEIVKVIQEIGNKTKVINDIVFQTKLLSFNASVEAARAGEHGKGFAVVAEEVGNLAAMSGNAAKEITTMLESSIQKVEGIVSETKVKVEALIQEGKTKVEGGMRVARDCAEVLDEIVKDVSSVSEMAGQISSASQEQSQGVHELTKAMNQLDQATQQNAATSQQTASAAEELSAQAGSLRTAVELLATTIQGGGGEGSLAAAAVAEPTRRFSKPAGNVIQLKKAKAVSAPAKPMKAAVGDGTVPDRSHPGFEEV